MMSTAGTDRGTPHEGIITKEVQYYSQHEYRSERELYMSMIIIRGVVAVGCGGFTGIIVRFLIRLCGRDVTWWDLPSPGSSASSSSSSSSSSDTDWCSIFAVILIIVSRTSVVIFTPIDPSLHI
jgi:hypothetical protein